MTRRRDARRRAYDEAAAKPLTEAQVATWERQMEISGSLSKRLAKAVIADWRRVRAENEELRGRMGDSP